MTDAEVHVGTRHGPRSVSRVIDAPSLGAACAAVEPPLWVWRTPEGAVHLGAGAAIRVVADGETRFGALAAGLEGITDNLPVEMAGPKAFLGAAFFGDGPTTRAWQGFPSAVATVPSVQIGWTPDGHARATVVDVDRGRSLETRLDALVESIANAPDPSMPIPGVRTRRYDPDGPTWRRQVATLRDRLDSAPLEKAVLAGTCTLDLDGSVPLGGLLEALIERHPDCWTFAHAPTASMAFVGATPERLATLADGRLETVALAGSVGRGAHPDTDADLRRYLIDREGDRHEQAHVVGDIVGRLGPLASAIRVGERTVRTLADVQHLETPITARLRDRVGLLEVCARLHPTPAVGGRPRASALATIRGMETIDRGWYAAPFGVLDPAGDGTVAVAIRSALVADRTATLFAGNGIVAECDPVEEWAELQLKYNAVGEVFR